MVLMPWFSKPDNANYKELDYIVCVMKMKEICIDIIIIITL